MSVLGVQTTVHTSVIGLHRAFEIKIRTKQNKAVSVSCNYTKSGHFFF